MRLAKTEPGRSPVRGIGENVDRPGRLDVGNGLIDLDRLF
jgi:hypothetical protein